MCICAALLVLLKDDVPVVQPAVASKSRPCCQPLQEENTAYRGRVRPTSMPCWMRYTRKKEASGHALPQRSLMSA